MIKHISIDCWNTLLFPTKFFYDERAEWLSKISGKSENEIINILNKLKLQYEQEGKTTGIGTPPTIQMAQLKRKLGIEMDLEYFIECQTRIFWKYPPMIATGLGTLQRTLKDFNITLSLACNTGFINNKLIRRCFEIYDIRDLFYFYIFSDFNNMLFKPNPEIYIEISKRVNVTEPSNVLHIGDDDSTDGELCRRTGMIYYNDSLEKLYNYIEYYNGLST